jgi:hypothetical protein
MNPNCFNKIEVNGIIDPCVSEVCEQSRYRGPPKKAPSSMAVVLERFDETAIDIHLEKKLNRSWCNFDPEKSVFEFKY